MDQRISSEFTAAEPILRAIRTTGSTRYQSNRDVPDDVVMAALEAARFGPSGGNRQPVRWIVIRDPQMRQTLAELYLPLWQRDMNMFLTGQMRTGATLGPAITAADHMAEHFADSPVVVVATVQKVDMHAHMKGPDGPNLIGGSSVYPMIQNFCIALRSLGVGSCITTLLTEHEEQVAELLGLPDDVMCACHILVGYPAESFPEKLNRMPLDQLVFAERYGHPHLNPEQGI
jgi:nitroreductase